MTLLQIILVCVFVVATIIGYVLIKNVPSLLHTPLMSGMNALSGITIIGALIATALALNSTSNQDNILGYLLGGLAIILATINVVGGFGITDKMLKMISKKEKKDE